MRIRPLLRAVLFAVVGALVAAGCVTPEPEPERAPSPEPVSLLGEAGSQPLTFRRVVFRIPVNQVLGEVRVGRRAREEWRWVVPSRASKSFNVAITDGLRARGYDVRDDSDALFDANERTKVRYEMAAILHDADVDFRFKYDPKREAQGEGVGVATVEVEVRLFDAIEKRTVYSRRFEGRGRDEGYKPNPMMSAVVDAVLKTTTDPSFVGHVAIDPGLTRAEGMKAPSLRLAACQEIDTKSLPDDLPATLQAVVEIQAGGVSGSGVIVSPDGWIVTAAHVVRDAPELWIRTREGVQLPATVEEVNGEADLALLRIPGRNHPCAPVRRAPGRLDLGSDVFAINVAIGEDRQPTVARGVVSGFPVQGGRRFIQTDASVNPGSSGGPLLAPDGSVAGITVSKMVGLNVEGLGLAVPAREAIEGLSIEIVFEAP